MRLLKGSIYGALLIVILILGLYVTPLAIANSGVVAAAGSHYSIIIGSSETIQFSIPRPSKLTGSLVSSSSISIYVMNQTEFNLLDPFEYPQAYTYSLGNSDSFSIDAVLPRSGTYYLVFYSITDSSQQTIPIGIRVASDLIVQPL